MSGNTPAPIPKNGVNALLLALGACVLDIERPTRPDQLRNMSFPIRELFYQRLDHMIADQSVPLTLLERQFLVEVKNGLEDLLNDQAAMDHLRDIFRLP